MDQERELMEISGPVDAVIYKNEENGYTVLRLRTENDESVTVVGCIPFAAPGEGMTVTEYNDKAFQTTVNLTSYTEDQEFKLVVNGEWIGSGELEKIEGDAASSITEGDTGSNLKLKAGKGYDIVAFWSTPSASVKNGWILEIVENTTVDIDAARVNAAQKQTIHNLKGIQLQKQQRGVNIVNGKKITVK